MRVTVNDRDFQRGLRALQRAGANMREVYEDLAEEALQIVQENFDAEGRPQKWQAWSAAYGEWRQTEKPGKILTLPGSGRLRNSMTKGKDGNIFDVSGAGASIGTNVEYAAAHQHGVKTKPHVIKPRHKKALMWAGLAHPVRQVNHPGSNIPARPFLVIPDSEMPRLMEIVEEYMQERYDG